MVIGPHGPGAGVVDARLILIGIRHVVFTRVTRAGQVRVAVKGQALRFMLKRPPEPDSKIAPAQAHS